MLKRLPYLLSAVIVALGCSVLLGGKVRAASPVFYDGVASFGIGRRSFYDSVDFNYATQTFNMPFFSDMGIVDSNMWGLPAAFSNTTYTTVPAYVSFTSEDLVRNGGYIYFSFMFAYWSGSGISNVQLANGRRSHAYLAPTGSLDFALANGFDLGSPTLAGSNSNSNTVLVNPTPASSGNEVIHVTEMNLPSGVNFPKTALFDLDDDKGTLRAYGLDDAYILGYGETADSSWIKGYVWQFRIQVPAVQSTTFNNTVYVDFSDCFRGSFTPVPFSNYNMQTNAGIYFIQSSLSGSMCNLVYMCPVSAFAVSTAYYDDIEAYLASIDNKLTGLAGFGESVSPAVLESYAALGSQAREEAARAASQMAAAVPSYDAADYDVDTYVDSHALDQFKQTVGFLSHSKILPIVMLVFILATVAYVFFGKKGG